ncbi:glycoside hydrolase family 140 protein [Aridibaculum aurantiacum]|uniref:glycoside hydrolase family 140 protein n=1 Tax=Aridibaculum aurantiacum TaxID=2810307 RepID=UPI001A95D419|nr:glycoside hydrolase family 140 protein [Aridibaculum aurantiacum]
MIKRNYLKLLVACMLVSLCSNAQVGNSMGLKISPDKRFFTDKEGKPFFWLGDTGWLLFSKLDRKEAEKYLEDRRAKGYNVIQAMVLHTVAAKNVYGDSALVRKSVAKPVTPAGNNPAVEAEYDYWDHIDYMVDLAAQKGLYMALVPIWGSNVKAGSVSRDEARSYAQFLAERYKQKPNIIWLNGGDIHGTDSMATWKIIGETLRKHDPNHLITFHPFGRTTSSQWFHNEEWLDFNMYQSGHRSYDLDTSRKEWRFGPDNYKFTNMDYNLKPTKPTLDGEPSYELIPYGLHDTTKPYWNANDMRRYAYWSVFAGAAGHTYGHNSVMQMHKPTDKGSAYGSKKYWDAALNDSGAAQMVHVKNLILSKPYFDRVPDQSLIAGKQGEKYDYLLATRGKDYAFIYTYTGKNFKVNMGKVNGDKVKASWYNPKNGQSTLLKTVSNKGTRKFNPPGKPAEGNDWVLVLESL